MSQIQVQNLTFYYDGTPDNVFEEVTFSIDSTWKLGLIGRNGKGKTTLFKLLLSKYEYQGLIHSNLTFDYFPYSIPKSDNQKNMIDFYEELKPESELWRFLRELGKLGLQEEVLYRPFETLSHGERTKVMIALLFSSENEFLLIDEPTNHLDQETRERMKSYLEKKKGFILVSHDRDLLDTCVDHVLVLNRNSIEVQSGNFTSWWNNKNQRDHFMQSENEKHKREITLLKKASERTRKWADKNEQTKIGFDAVKEHDRNISARAYIGAKTKKMQSRVRQMENRLEKEIVEKEGLLNDIETVVELKMFPLRYHKDVLIRAKEFGIRYPSVDKTVFESINIEVRQGERIFLCGKNGCGKSSFLKAVLTQNEKKSLKSEIVEKGILETASGMIISYVDQDTEFLKGGILEFCKARKLDESLFFAVLRKMGLERAQFDKDLHNLSEGQKKKILITASLLTPAHLYMWDEPLNYIDIFSRIQIENLIKKYQPTMLLVEHDVQFQEKIATKIIQLS